MQLVAQAVSHATPDTHILVGDETKMQHLPVLRARWMRIASQLRIPTPEDNRYFYIFGVLNILTGGLTYALLNKQNRFTLIEFLERILLVYPTGPIILILDNAKYQHCQRCVEMVGETPTLDSVVAAQICPGIKPCRQDLVVSETESSC